MAAQKKGKGRANPNEPTIENRRARHDYQILETLECGIRLTGTEVKSIRRGQASLGEGYVRATDQPIALTLYGVHVAEYPPAGPNRQHEPTRARPLLAHRRQIKKLADKSRDRGMTLVPLKMYFLNGKVKLLIGVGHGKRKADKRQDLARKEAKRDIDRAMSRRR
ncbi:MAG: SsrA-binding protein SmpB [Phycisphaerales bacterium]|nr:SsrA-binding protein SmpB [Phycisphaerales bacterium]NNM27841.1 SsrA-binding protein SmpB [Phycisphaerales bacterium]